MKKFVIPFLVLFPLVAAAVTPPAASPGGAAGRLDVVEVTHGFGFLLPHRVQRLDGSGSPTAAVVPIRTRRDLIGNVRSTNPILRDGAVATGRDPPERPSR